MSVYLLVRLFKEWVWYTEEKGAIKAVHMTLNCISKALLSRYLNEGNGSII